MSTNPTVHRRGQDTAYAPARTGRLQSGGRTCRLRLSFGAPFPPRAQRVWQVHLSALPEAILLGLLLLTATEVTKTAAADAEIVASVKAFMASGTHDLEVDWDEGVGPGAGTQQTAPLHIHAIQQGNAFLLSRARNEVVAHYDSLYWDIVPGAKTNRVVVEYYQVRQDVDVALAAGGPTGTERLARELQFSAVAQLGLLEAQAGSITWSGDRFAAVESQTGAPIRGRLVVAGGRPARLEVTSRPGRNAPGSLVRYYYERPLELSFFPSRIVISRKLGDAVLSTITINVTSIRRLPAPLDESYFSPAPFLKQYGTNVMTVVYSNNWPYVVRGAGMKRVAIGPGGAPGAGHVGQRTKLRRAITLFLCVFATLPCILWYRQRMCAANKNQTTVERVL